MAHMNSGLAIIAIWVLTIIVIFAFPQDLPGLTCLAVSLFPITGIGLIIFFLVTFVRSDNKRSSAIGLLLVTFIGAVYLTNGFTWGTQLHLRANQNRYEAIIAKLSQARSREEREKICNDDCLILSDQPLCVSFQYCHCLLTWQNIVYDPTGAVNDTDIARLHKLSVFLFGTKRLTGDWYIGYFGD
jgi:hypothetical protein